ncbi:hypothetical protein K3495_g137 [Podosphaera aphanis]|nr:hypothetical protein K3495_g137 [Podosphaera aphanis]
MSEVELVEFFNDNLLEVFYEEFVSFDDADFKKCEDIILRKPKNLLVAQSLKNIEKYFSKEGRSIHKNKGKETRKYESEEDEAQSSIDPAKPISEPSFKMAGMSKLYNSSEKYTGSKLDNLDFKFQIFKQKCDIVNISGDEIRPSLFMVFDREALDLYYLRCSTVLNIHKLLDLMRSQIEGHQKKRNAQNDWNKITLRAITDKNLENLLSESCKVMVKQLRTFQLSLRMNFQDEITLRDMILKAVTSVPECRLACMMPDDPLNDVINKIRGTIGMTTMSEHKPGEAMFVNRKFHRNHDRGQQNGNYRIEGRHSDNKNSKSNHRDRRCYIRKKHNFRSWKHTDDERKQTRN